jgi:adenylate kinase
MSPPYRSLNLVFLGPPGSGKGTQARLLSERYRIPHVAPGDMLREEIERASVIGKQAKKAVENGALVPDPVLRGLVLQRLQRDDCARGFLLDGYPRTVEQAGALDDILAERGRAIERVILFDVPDDVAAERLNGRRIHQPSGRAYHVTFDPPRQADVDDQTGEQLVKMSDDSANAVSRRLRAYQREIVALVDLYRRRGLLVEIDGNQSKEQVTEALLHAVGAPVGT